MPEATSGCDILDRKRVQDLCQGNTKTTNSIPDKLMADNVYATEEVGDEMTDMVERVARAICENNHRAIFGTSVSWEGISAETMEHFRSVARAAIEAMREPTEAMKRLDESLASFWDRNTAPPTLMNPLGSHTGASYQQMIDEALK